MDPPSAVPIFPKIRTSACVFHHYIGRLLACHINSGHDEIARNLWENRRVDNAQTLRSTHAETAVEDRHWIARRADLVRTRGVMAPRFVAHELTQLIVGIVVGAGHFF